MAEGYSNGYIRSRSVQAYLLYTRTFNRTFLTVGTPHLSGAGLFLIFQPD